MFKNKLTDTYTYEELCILHNGFQKLLDNTLLFNNGLCLWITTISCKDHISECTANLLLGYINSNIPLSYHKIRFFLCPDGYWWKAGEIEPRIKYIKKHMKKIDDAIRTLSKKYKYSNFND